MGVGGAGATGLLIDDQGLVIAETWHAGWGATLDGSPARLFRVDHVQMALPLPEGRHRVALRYRPPGLAAGLLLGLASAVGLAAWRFRERRPRG